MSDATKNPWRMDAYYYSFTPTGVEAVDRLLNAIAWAGKAYHSTDSWGETIEPYPHCEGKTCIEWMQNAANRAAREFQVLDQAREALEAVAQEQSNGYNIDTLLEDIKEDIKPLIIRHGGHQNVYAINAVLEGRKKAKAALVAMKGKG